MLNKIKPFAVHLAVAGVVIVGGTAAAATFSSQNNSQANVPTVTQEAAERGEGRPAEKTEAAASINTDTPTNEPQASEPTEVGGFGGAGASNSSEPASTTPVVPTNEPEPVPAPTRTGHTMRFVDVSPADKPNTKAAEYCDYHYSDGSTQTEWKATITMMSGFSQPISAYTESNPPNNYSPC